MLKTNRRKSAEVETSYKAPNQTGRRHGSHLVKILGIVMDVLYLCHKNFPFQKAIVVR
jgi:hypothetical protein